MKLTSKENIEREVLESDYYATAKSASIYFANRVLEDMQEELERKNTMYHLANIEKTKQIAELSYKLTTARADTLKEVLEFVKQWRGSVPADETSAFIQELLNQKP